MNEVIINSKITEDLRKVSSFIDYPSFIRIINKLTDFGEIITEGKLASLINFNYRLNASQSSLVTELLVDVQALSTIYAIAQKGKRVLDVEFISNIFSDVNNPSTISSYLSIRTVIENRLNHQIQQYNMNMSKSNTTMAIPVNELHGHVKTFKDLMNSSITISHKARHGFITASLHDAYLTIMNRFDWWNDKTYQKFFFNDDNSPKKSLNLITRETRLTLFEIDVNIKKVMEYFENLSLVKTRQKVQEKDLDFAENDSSVKIYKKESGTAHHQDKLLMTPFGAQYGQKIDEIIESIFNDERIKHTILKHTDGIRHIVIPLFSIYKTLEDPVNVQRNINDLMDMVYYLLGQEYGIKKFTEENIYSDRKIPFMRYFSDIKADVEDFLMRIFIIFFEESFSPVFRIIRSLDMKQYACAFIIKRIYMIKGEEIPVFGYFLIKAIARHGKIKVA
jgi:hypothetical protein